MNRLLALALLVGGTAQAAEPFVQAGDRTPHVQLRASALYATFSPGVGAALRATVQVPVWDGQGVTGSVDVGLSTRYVWGGGVLYPWLSTDPDERATGADHVATVALDVGHTFHLGRQRRSSLGIHAFAGLAISHRAWTLAWADHGLEASATQTTPVFTWGPELDYHYRVHRNVGLHVVLGGVSPTQSGLAGPMLHVGAGVSVYVR